MPDRDHDRYDPLDDDWISDDELTELMHNPERLDARPRERLDARPREPLDPDALAAAQPPQTDAVRCFNAFAEHEVPPYPREGPRPWEAPEPEEPGDTLTERQLAFCDHYVERPVAVQAARAAGYAEETARTQAARLLRHPRIMQRIVALRRRRSLDHAFRRETLHDKFEAVFAEAIEQGRFDAALRAVTMQARLAGFDEVRGTARVPTRSESMRESLVWEALTRLEQKLSEIVIGDFPGAAAVLQPTPANR